ncbi:MAG: hypothetical protein ACYCO4_01800 [Sulfobacillus sp.]
MYKSQKVPAEPRYLLAIIGSSNVTRPAFGTIGTFNIEADVVLWEDSVPGLKSVMLGVLEELEPNALGVIRANYNPTVNGPLNARLAELEQRILGTQEAPAE